MGIQVDFIIVDSTGPKPKVTIAEKSASKRKREEEDKSAAGVGKGEEEMEEEKKHSVKKRKAPVVENEELESPANKRGREKAEDEAEDKTEGGNNDLYESNAVLKKSKAISTLTPAPPSNPSGETQQSVYTMMDGPTAPNIVP